MPARHKTVREMLGAFARGELRCEEAARDALAAAERTEAVFIKINHDIAEQAARIDRARESGAALPALAGLPVSLKDLFNVQGECTFAGSKVLRHEAAPEAADAAVVGHLRNAGALFVGRANMSEFAFSGMGLNPHYGTPKCVWDRATGRLPGGSSSGTAVGIAEGVVPAGAGSDTAGSCRAPAAFNGIVGVKPSFGRMSLRGVYPLSPTSDAPGPLANDLDGCFILDHVMTGRLKHGEELPELRALNANSFKLLAPQAEVCEGLDAEVQAAFARALEWLQSGGVEVESRETPALDRCVGMFSKRAVAVFEAWQAHAERLRARGDEYDPYVRRRIENGRNFDAETRHAIYREKAEVAAECARQMRGADALVYPTAMCIPPAMREAEELEKMPAVNFKCLRNTSTVNFFDGCAVSLPCHLPGEAPVGLMLAAGNGADERLYQVAAAVEGILEGERGGP